MMVKGKGWAAKITKFTVPQSLEKSPTETSSGFHKLAGYGPPVPRICTPTLLLEVADVSTVPRQVRREPLVSFQVEVAGAQAGLLP